MGRLVRVAPFFFAAVEFNVLKSSFVTDNLYGLVNEGVGMGEAGGGGGSSPLAYASRYTSPHDRLVWPVCLQLLEGVSSAGGVGETGRYRGKQVEQYTRMHIPQ